MLDIAFVKKLAFIEILDDNKFEGQFLATFGEFILSWSYLGVTNDTPLYEIKKQE